MNESEEKLRARIRRAFSSTNGRRSVNFTKRVEDQILTLMKEYAIAENDQREIVYRKGEERILRTLRSRRAKEGARPT
jgi:hypothetical protein